MTCRNNIARYWHNVSIKAKLELGIGLLIVLLVIISGTVLTGRYLLFRAEAEMEGSQEIQRLVLEMDRGMEEARRLHGEFFLHVQEIGFAAAHEQFAQASVAKIAEVVTLSKALQERITNSTLGQGLRANRVDVNLYLSFAKRFADTSIEAVELFTGLRAPERGLEPRLNKALDEILISFPHSYGDDLGHLFMQMKTHIQEYQIMRQRPLMQRAYNVELELRTALREDQSFDEAERQKIGGLLDQVHVISELILAADLAIKSRSHDFALQAVVVDTVSATLEKLANEEWHKSQSNILRIRRTVFFIIVPIALVGLVVAFMIAMLINRSVIQRITRLTRSAADLREGHLDVQIPEDSADELGLLARTFNCMTGRIRELVNTLESKVAQRTAELSASEWRFRQLFENSGSGILLLEADEQGEDFLVKDCNKAALAIEQRPREEMIGRRITEVLPAIEEFGLLALLREVRENGQPLRQAPSFYHDERWQGWRESAVYRLASGEIVWVCDDRTAHKQAQEEKRVMEVKLQRARKMEALGLMAGGVAHDLNNILSGIVGFPDILLMSLPADSSLRKLVEIIKESGLRAAAVVADLLTVARSAASRKENASLNTLIQEYLVSPEYLLLKSRHPQIVCETAFDSNLSLVLCSPVHIKKCIMNLVNNAMESIEGPGRVTVSTGREVVAEPLAQQNKVKPGEFVVLKVADSGKGINDKDLEHIFEPFYSKKVMGVSGTGLGLAVVWNSVEDHGGMIQVESSPQGTAFSLYFPLSGQLSAGAPTPSTSGDFRGRGEKILVVDDEAVLRELANTLLQSLGYTVFCVASGELAVEYLKEERVDLVLLDMIMDPGINGLETYRQIRSRKPLQKAIVVSGFAESDAVRAVQALGAKRFIKKPYILEQLGRTVREELDDGATG